MKDILKEFRLKLWNVYATIFQSSLYDEKQLKEKEDVMVKFLEKAISQTREETLGEIKRLLPNNSSDGDTDFADGYDTYRKEVLNILNNLKK